MKKITFSLIALGLFNAAAAFAETPTPLPAAIAEHSGPIRIAVIRNLGSDDNTTQFVSGAIQEGKSLGLKSAPSSATVMTPNSRTSLTRRLARNTTALFFLRDATPTPPRW